MLKNFPSVVFVLLLTALCTFTACHKDDDHDKDENDTVAPELTVTSPTANQAIAGTVTIAGRATDETNLHVMSIKVTKDADGTTMFSKEPNVHDMQSYDFSENWTPNNIPADTPVTLTVTVEDHNEHVVTKTVKFVVKP